MAIGRDNRIGSELFKSSGLPSKRLETEIRKLQWSSQNSTKEQIFPAENISRVIALGALPDFSFHLIDLVARKSNSKSINIMSPVCRGTVAGV